MTLHISGAAAPFLAPLVPPLAPPFGPPPYVSDPLAPRPRHLTSKQPPSGADRERYCDPAGLLELPSADDEPSLRYLGAARQRTARGTALTADAPWRPHSRVDTLMIGALMRCYGALDHTAALKLSRQVTRQQAALFGPGPLAPSERWEALGTEARLWIAQRAGIAKFVALGAPGYLQVHPLTSARIAFGQLATLPVPPYALATFDEISLFAARSAVRGWLDWHSAASALRRPLTTLHAVMQHHRHTLPAVFLATLDAGALEDAWQLQAFDQAALAWNRLHYGSSFAHVADPAGILSSVLLRSHYSAALRADRQLQQWLDTALAPPGQDRLTELHHDGFSFRNGFGKTFDGVWRALRHQPATQALIETGIDADVLQAALAQRFVELGESAGVDHRIGTPVHSFASVQLRFLGSLKSATQAEPVAPRRIVEALRHMDEDWTTAGMPLALRPSALFALHLASSAGAEFVAQDWRETLWQAHTEPELFDAAGSGPRTVFSALYRLAGKEALGERDTLTRFYQRVADLAQDGDTPPLDTPLHSGSWQADRRIPWTPAIVAAARQLAKTFTRRHLGVERRLAGAGFDARLNAALVYADERLDAYHDGPAPFSFDQATAQLLRAHCAMPADAVDVAIAPAPPIARTQIEQFVSRARHDAMAIFDCGNGSKLNPRAELNRAVDIYIERLRTNTGWLQARASENLRLLRRPLSTAAVQAEMLRLFDGLRPSHLGTHPREPDSDHATLVDLVPVMGPLYMMARGVRDHAGRNVMLGSVLLGIDLAVGAGFVVKYGLKATVAARRAAAARAAAGTAMRELTRLAAQERVTLATFRHAVERLGLPGAEIWPATHHVRLDNDPFGVLLRVDANAAPGSSRLIARARAGEQVSWRDLQLVYLQDEDRVVPVVAAAGALLEISWQSGAPVRNALPIFRDAADGRYWRTVPLAIGAASVSSRAEQSAFRQRLTVADTLDTLGRRGDFSKARARKVFTRHFRFTADTEFAQAALVRSDILHAIERSHDYTRLMNRFGQDPAAASWEIRIADDIVKAAVLPDATPPRLNLPSPLGVAALPGYYARAAVRAFTRRMVVLHESLHVLTGKDDVRPLTSKMLNRGTIGYWGDKVLFDMGEDFEPRVMYESPRRSLAGLPGPDPALRAAEAFTLAEQENAFLDRKAALGTPRVAATDWILGQQMQERATIVELLSIAARLECLPPMCGLVYQDDFQAFSDLFVLQAVEPVARAVRQILDYLFVRTTELQQYATYWHATARPQAAWSIVVGSTFDSIAERIAGAAPDRALSFRIDQRTRQIHLFDDGAVYLSDQGVRPVERERQLALALYALFLTDDAVSRTFETEHLANRGAHARLADKALRQAGFALPQQLARRLAASTDTTLRAQLEAVQSNAARAARKEDRFIDRR